MTDNNNIAKALLSLLTNNIVRFTFRKVDGTIRNAVGTRNLCLACQSLGVSIPMPKTGRNNPNAYYDLEKNAWRSFVPENVLSINGIEIAEIKGIKGGQIVKVGNPVEVDIPINTSGFRGGLPIGGGMGVEIPIGKGGFGGGFGIGADKPKDKAEPTNFDLGKIKKAVGGMVGTPTYEPKGIALPISGVGGKEMTIDDFARLVAKYVLEELVNRIK